ncbi:MAG: hypothetical protein NUV98_02760 [Candidatus Roizmanbacteria bacterium]|nr:hypothetical protein [Candidatus Roizmanbacteria bacterium]
MEKQFLYQFLIWPTVFTIQEESFAVYDVPPILENGVDLSIIDLLQQSN